MLMLSGNIRCPRKARRGLGLIDAMLALVVLTVIGVLAGNMVGVWVEQQIRQAEARALSAWADAGETWVLSNRDEFHSGSVNNITSRITPPRAFPDPLTPYRRRTVTVWVRASGNAGGRRAEVIAVVRQDQGSQGAPFPGDGISGVGAIIGTPGSTEVRGPGIAWDMRHLIAQRADIAGPGDMVALRRLRLSLAGSPYLHRQTVPGHPELNRMETNFDMGNQVITGVGSIMADRIITQRIDGPITVDGGMTVNGALSVQDGTGSQRGRIEARTMTLTDDLRATRLTVGDVDAGTINARNARVGTLNVTGGCSGCQSR